MTPEELDAFGEVMKRRGIFRFREGATLIELSQHAIQTGQAEQQAKAAKEEAAALALAALAKGETEPAPPNPDEDPDERWDFAATEGLPE